MNQHLSLDYSNIVPFVTSEMWDTSYQQVLEAHSLLVNRTGRGNDFLGWFDLPETVQPQLERIMDVAHRIQQSSDAMIVVGIGGSYLGARAVIEAMTPPFSKPPVEIMYAGHNIDGEYLRALLSSLDDKRVSVNVISKSGTTTEPALAFRVIKNWMEKKYSKDEARKRIIATTDAKKGTLRKLADDEGYETFVIPDDVGGRFSVLTPVGLLPIAAAGISINDILHGASSMRDRISIASYESNPSFLYAMMRHAMFTFEKTIEVLSTFTPSMQYFCEWWKQLFGESEGKDGKGIFPASVVFTTDLHSMGQYIQDGMRDMFETFLVIDQPRGDLSIPSTNTDDGLEYLAGKKFSIVNEQAFQATAFAHLQGGVPNMNVVLPSLTADSIGELIYFFEAAVAFSGYALGINPFDQPGVEVYKKNMFALLAKPGFEKEQSEITSQLRHSAPHIVE